MNLVEDWETQFNLKRLDIAFESLNSLNDCYELVGNWNSSQNFQNL